MKYSVKLESVDLIELVEKELALKGFKIVDGYELDYDGPLSITVDIEPDNTINPIKPLTKIPTLVDIAVTENPEDTELPDGALGSAQNPIDMGSFAAASRSIERSNPGKFPTPPRSKR